MFDKQGQKAVALKLTSMVMSPTTSPASAFASKSEGAGTWPRQQGIEARAVQLIHVGLS
jgi:hypothetical protein